MPNDTPIPVQEYPDIFQYVTVRIAVPDITHTVLYAERDVIIDGMFFVNETNDADDTLSVGYDTDAADAGTGATDPDNIIDAVTINADRTVQDLTGDMLDNRVPAGRILSARLTDVGLGDTLGTLIVRFRTARK